jgi:hypothetical protein
MESGQANAANSFHVPEVECIGKGKASADPPSKP